MSETTLCQRYGEYCAAAGIYTGGGITDSASRTIQLSGEVVDNLLNSLGKVSQNVADAAAKATRDGASSVTRAIASAGNELNKLNAKALMMIKDGEYGASRLARHMMGGVTESPFAGQFYGGGEPVIAHSQYMVDSLDFVRGAGEEVLETLNTRVAVFKKYLDILSAMMKNSASL